MMVCVCPQYQTQAEPAIVLLGRNGEMIPTIPNWKITRQFHFIP